MSEFNGVRGADGAIYHTTTSAAARLGVSYENAKALIASGQIPSVSAESVGVSVNKPGARLVSEYALSAYLRGATMVTPMATVASVPPGMAVNATPVPLEKPTSKNGWRVVGIGCVGFLGLVMVLIVITAIFGSSDSGSPPPRSNPGNQPASSQPNNDLTSPCQMLFLAVEEGDPQSALIAWILILKGVADESTLGFTDSRELELYRDLRDAPLGDETGRAAETLVEHCISRADG